MRGRVNAVNMLFIRFRRDSANSARAFKRPQGGRGAGRKCSKGPVLGVVGL